MKQKSFAILLLFATLFLSPNLQAIENFREVYPPVIQSLEGKLIFSGDRHGDFEGDLVAYLSDGSMWKVHPSERRVFERWNEGDLVRLKVRTDFYWFKREHKFALYNESLGQSVKVMIVKHITEPYPLQIVSVDTYSKGLEAHWVPGTELVFENGHMYTRTVWHVEYRPGHFRKVLALSDGSTWVIKEKFDKFVVGETVYIGAQGVPKEWYDFVLITGTEREAVWTYGRPQH